MWTRPPFKPCVRISRTRLTKWALRPAHCAHPGWLPEALGSDPKPTLRVAHLIKESEPLGVVGSGLAGHALMRIRAASVPTAGTLPSRCGIRRSDRQYYDPLGLPLPTARFRIPLIRASLPQLGPRRRVSRVPHLSLHACCSPYPAETPCAYNPGWQRAKHGLRRDMSGSALGL